LRHLAWPSLVFASLILGCRPAAEAPAPVGTAGPAAVLTVSLTPLRDGLVASVHKGPKRGVRRVLKEGRTAGQDVWTVTAGRAAAVFEENSALCPLCGVLQATVDVTAGRFTPPLSGQKIESVAASSLHVRVPVRLRAAQSMARPGWWEVRLGRDTAVEASADWVTPFSAKVPSTLTAALTDLAFQVALAEAALMPGRSPLLELRPWATETAELRLDRVDLRLSKRLLELRLYPSATAGLKQSASPAEVVVMGNEFQLAVSEEFAGRLRPAEATASPTSAPLSLDGVLLKDARGRVGPLSYSGSGGDGLLLGGSFVRAPKAPRLPPKPLRPGESRLPRRQVR
jgi:hypothetical protein